MNNALREDFIQDRRKTKRPVRVSTVMVLPRNNLFNQSSEFFSTSQNLRESPASLASLSLPSVMSDVNQFAQGKLCL